MQVVQLTTTKNFPQHGFLDGGIVVLAHEGFHAQALGWRRGNDRQVANAGHGHVERTWNGRGGEGKDVDLGTQGLDTFFLLHTKAVFFVDDQQSQVLKLDVFLQQLVGADHNIGFAFDHSIKGLLGFLSGFKARQHIHFYRPFSEAVGKVLVMLLSQQGGWHQHGHLLAALYGHKGCAHGHFGFTKAHITTHQSVHWPRGGHVVNDSVNGGLLIWCFFVRESRRKTLVFLVRAVEGKAFAGLAAGIDIEQLSGGVADFLSGFAFRLFPLVGTEFADGDCAVLGTAVTGNQVQRRYWHVKFAGAGVFQHQEFIGLTASVQCLQAHVAADAVVEVDHRCAFF